MRAMKDSGIEWIGQIPREWEITKIGMLYNLRITKVSDTDYLPLSVTKIGVLPQLETVAKTNAHDDRKLVKKGDFVINSRSDRRGSCGISNYNGSVSLINIVLKPKNNMNSGYYSWLFKTAQFADEFYKNGHGIVDDLWTTTWPDMKRIVLSVPKYSEQQQIADFLDTKCSEIDATAKDIQKEISLLEEYKKAVIYNTISNGLQGKEKTAETDDVWGQLPKDWKLVDIKYLFEIVKRIAGKEGFDVLSVTQKGLKVKDITSGDGQLADNYSGYQFVYPTDYVMNHMDLLTGWVDCSELFGVTSPDYRVFRLRDKSKNNLMYFKYVMQCCYLNKIFYSLGQGVSNLGRWRLQTSSFNNFKIPVPPKSEQDEIADYLDNKCSEIDALIADKKKQLDILTEYKKSLIYEYVTGKKEVPAEK